MKKILLAVVLLASCKGVPPTDKSVQSKFTETREKTQYVSGGSGAWIAVPYTAYILIATDGTECEVGGREYAATHERSLFSCNWEEK